MLVVFLILLLFVRFLYAWWWWYLYVYALRCFLWCVMMNLLCDAAPYCYVMLLLIYAASYICCVYSNELSWKETEKKSIGLAWAPSGRHVAGLCRRPGRRLSSAPGVPSCRHVACLCRRPGRRHRQALGATTSRHVAPLCWRPGRRHSSKLSRQPGRRHRCATWREAVGQQLTAVAVRRWRCRQTGPST